MEIPQENDWVRTETGAVGRVTFVTDDSAYVQVVTVDGESQLGAFLLNELTKIDAPADST